MFRRLNCAILFVLLCVSARHAAAQGWDASGNNLLNGTSYFREVFYIVGDNAGDLQELLALYGTVSFDCKGGYTMTATLADSRGLSLGGLANRIVDAPHPG